MIIQKLRLIDIQSLKHLSFSGTCLRKQYVVLKELRDLANNLQAQYNK